MNEGIDVNKWPAVAKLFRIFSRGTMLLLGGGTLLGMLTADPSAPLTFVGFTSAPPIEKVTALIFGIGLSLLLALPLARNLVIALTARGERKRKFVLASALGALMMLGAFALAIAQLPIFG